MSANGCTEYVKATVDVYFEPEHACCKYCPMLQTYSRDQCNRTGEYIIDTRGRGAWCPLKFESEVDNGEV